MSSWRKVEPRRTHRERAQPKERLHFGLLEKKKDYKLRAKDYHRKQDRLKKLKEKAALKNPEEFYYGMISAGKKGERKRDFSDGVKPRTAEEQALVLSHDANYVAMKKTIEGKKIQSLVSQLHFVDTANQAKRTVFVADEDDDKPNGPAAKAQYLNARETKDSSTELDDSVLRELELAKKKKYKELEARLDREDRLGKLLDNMEMEKNLMGKGRRIRVQHKDPRTGTPAIYKWKTQRKK